VVLQSQSMKSLNELTVVIVSSLGPDERLESSAKLSPAGDCSSSSYV